jgi:hypothetical protein
MDAVYVLPAGTICKRGEMSFRLANDTEIRCHSGNWPSIQNGFKPEASDQRLSFNQVEQLPVNPRHAAALPVMSTTNNSSLESSIGDNQSRTSVGDISVTTIHVESKQCQ